jgi:hypothetical protein
MAIVFPGGTFISINAVDAVANVSFLAFAVK